MVVGATLALPVLLLPVLLLAGSAAGAMPDDSCGMPKDCPAAGRAIGVSHHNTDLAYSELT